MTMVSMALSEEPIDTCDLATCTRGDTDRNGEFTIDEILQAVNSLLNGCAGTTAAAAAVGEPKGRQ
jgi:hypothetical protein